MSESNEQEIFLFPISYSQSQLWYLYEMDPESTAYNIPFAFRCRGKLDIDALRTAVQEIVNRFESLRTNFAVVEDEVRQVLKPPKTIPLQVESVTAEDGTNIDEVIRQLVDEEARTSFDLRNDTLSRARVLRAGEDDHVVLLNFHHIAVDHIAVLRLQREIESLYSAAVRHKDLPPAAEELQYVDYAVWQREYLSPDVLAEKLAFWSDNLQGVSGTLSLPTDHPRPPVQTFSGDELKFSFDQELSENLRELCRQHRISLFVALLAALKIVFFRYTRQQDITVGCPFANRNLAEVEDTVGLFMNLLPIATTIDGGMSFLDVAGSVKRTAAGAQAQQDTPFEEIVKDANVERDPSRNPLLQAGFTFQEPPMVIDLDGLAVESLPVHNGGAKLDLNFWLWEDEQCISGLTEYNTDLYEPETVSRLVGHMERLLAGVVANPNESIDRLPLLSEQEFTEVTETWNDTATGFSHESLLAIIDNMAQEHPDKIATSWEGGAYTYAELIDASRSIASAIRKAGGKKGDIIGICLGRTGALVAALLGTWRHGAAYLPLDPGYPDDRLRYMIEDAGIGLVIADGDVRGRFDGQGCEIILADDCIAAGHDDDMDAWSVPDLAEAAYVIYTSGSTGRPKGVQLSHGAVRNFIGAMAEHPGMTADDRVAAVTTISFDISVLEIFLPLAVGGTTHLVSRETVADGAALVDALQDVKASVLQATPSTFRMLISAGWQGNDQITLLCGGEPLPKDLAAELGSRCRELWNMYGPTETTVWSTIARIEGGEEEISIGRPIANTVVRVLDASGMPVPVGVPGELYIGGAGVADGYLNRPELNAVRFVEDPLGSNGGRFYRTGDRVKWRPDGSLIHLGRNDRQVKLRGFRIELEEIESAILNVSDGEHVAVTTWEAGPADTRLVAYIVARDGRKVSTMKLRKELRRTLPDFMVPQHFVELAELPMTENGKVNRKSLPSPVTSETSREKPRPSGQMQEIIAAVWEDALGQGGVSPVDNFFEIGGHSLLAMKVIAELEKRTGFRMSARMIVMQSLAELAEILDAEVGQMKPVSADNSVEQVVG